LELSRCGAVSTGRACHPWLRASGEGERMSTSILVSILITFLVIVLVLYLVNLLPIDGRARQIVRIIVIIIGVLSLLRYLGVGF
jgi:hypothetical protein